MLRISVFVAACLSVVHSCADDAELESFVYDALARCQNLEDELREEGYCCMARGILERPPRLSTNADGRLIPTMLITCSKGEYTAYLQSYQTTARVRANNRSKNRFIPRIQPHTTWKYEAFEGSKVKISETPKQPPVIMPRSRYARRSNPYDSSVSKHDIFVDWLWPGQMEYKWLPRNRMMQFVSDMDLKSVRDLGSGYVEALFHHQLPSQLDVHKIVFSRAHGGMPVETRITVKSQQPGWEDDLRHAKLEWAKSSGRWLPKRIKYVYTGMAGKEVIRQLGDFVLDWKVGRAIPERCFDFEADPRAELANLLDFDFDVYEGTMMVKPAQNAWALPEEIHK